MGERFLTLNGELGHPLFYTRALVSPAVDALTLNFAITLMSQEKLGQDNIPDYLSISFSGVDAVNHFFGPNSLENEDVVRQLDRQLEELFAYIDKEVGLEHTVVVLSADHGMADMPEYISEQGYEAGRLYSEDVEALANQIGKKLYGIDDVVRFFFRPYLYVHEDAVKRSGNHAKEVEQAIARELMKHPGIAMAVPRQGSDSIFDNWLHQQIQNNYHPQRSGHIYIAQSPYWFMFERGSIGAMHGSPWRYDTHVPLVFAGAGIEAKSDARLVHPTDVAPTLSALLKIHAPAGSQGSVLESVVHSRLE